MSKQQIYLQLAEEFGGARFGPIELPEYRLGSAEGNEVQLAEGLGVEPWRVRLMRKGGETFYLSPVERSAAVWLYREGAGEPELLHGPTIIQVGDGFSLVTAEGVRFTLIAEEEQRPKRGQGGGMMPGGPGMPDGARRYGGRMISEVWRRMRAAALATYFGRMLQNTWFFVRTGQIFSPLYVIGFLTMMSGWGFSLRACSQNNNLTARATTAEEKHEDCRREISGLRTRGSGTQDSFPELIGEVLGDSTWESSLAWVDLVDAVKADLVVLFNSASRIQTDWVLGNKATYPPMVKALTDAGFPTEAAQVLAWAGTSPLARIDTRLEPTLTASGETASVLWGVRRTDDTRMRACLRGPMRLSFAQGLRIGLDVAHDGFRDEASFAVLQGAARAGRRDEVIATYQDLFNHQRGFVGMDASGERAPKGVEEVEFPGGRCIYKADMADDRQSYSRVARALARSLGPEARGLPEPASTNWLSARLVRLYLLDLPARADGPQWWELPLEDNLGSDLTTLVAEDAAAARHVAGMAGRVLARAVAIPCILRMELEQWPDTLGQAPDFDTCAILMARAEFGRL